MSTMKSNPGMALVLFPNPVQSHFEKVYCMIPRVRTRQLFQRLVYRRWVGLHQLSPNGYGASRKCSLPADINTCLSFSGPHLTSVGGICRVAKSRQQSVAYVVWPDLETVGDPKIVDDFVAIGCLQKLIKTKAKSY